jgi:hypothetical protein
VSGTTPVPLTQTTSGDVSSPITLPFAMPYYGQSFTKVWVSNNGAAAFVDPGPYAWYYDTSLPDKWVAPLAGMLPFWGSGGLGSGGVYTGTVGSGASQRFVIEWRVVADTGPYFSYEVVLSPNGDVTFNYSGLVDDYRKGDSSTVGITSPGGNYGLQYLFQEPDLVSGTAVTFNYPDEPNDLNLGTVTGTVSRDGVPVAGQEVSIDNLTTTTDTDGHYEFDYVEPGLYDATTRNNCDGFHQAVDVEGDTVLDMPVGVYLDGFGYHCDMERVDFIPGTTAPADPEGDVDFGFAFPFYGETYTTASIQGGGVYVRNGSDFDPDVTGGDIEFNVGGFDFDNSQLLTATVGSAPNRQFVVEWRDIAFTDHPGIRLTWEMIFGEDGTVKMVFPDPPPPDTFDYPIRSWFYALDFGEIEYTEDGNGFYQGKSLVFHPPAAS